jgi:replicative DNA helicase
VLEASQASLFSIADRQTTGGFVSAKAMMPEIIAYVEQFVADKRRITGVPTGFSGLDDMTRVMQPGDLIVVAGRPSMGKTSFGMNVAQHAARVHGRRVGVFSLEMSRKSLWLRLLASEARIDHHRLLTGHIGDDAWPKWSTALGRLDASGISIDDTSTATVFDVRAKSRRLKADGGLDLVIIDSTYRWSVHAGCAGDPGGSVLNPSCEWLTVAEAAQPCAVWQIVDLRRGAAGSAACGTSRRPASTPSPRGLVR